MLFEPKNFWSAALNAETEKEFNELALQLYAYQSEHVSVYRDFLRLIHKNNFHPQHYSEIPFLPIQLFRQFKITDSEKNSELIFSSSGTTGSSVSKHYVLEASLYDSSLKNGFSLFYGDPAEFTFLALLPSYLERSESSLVYMMQQLMQCSRKSENGFFLHNHQQLNSHIQKLTSNHCKIFIIGVTYALLDFFSEYPILLSKDSIVMETGGMKGKRKEMVRTEVHNTLSENTGLKNINSEYGMTELLSQAYSSGNGLFRTPHWMQVLIGDIHDPFSLVAKGDTGIVKVIDLANIHSCAFIETQDLGRFHGDTFEILGRMDHSELRGCNLMVG